MKQWTQSSGTWRSAIKPATAIVKGEGPHTHTRLRLALLVEGVGRCARRRVSVTRPFNPDQSALGSDRVWRTSRLQRKRNDKKRYNYYK